MSAPTTANETGKKTALVTGASGFIGSALVQRLLDRQYSVHVLSRHPLEEGPDASDCHQFTGDIRDEEILREACAGVDVVFHLAAYAHVNQLDDIQMHATNVEGTRAVLAAALVSGVRRIVFFSSSLADDALTSYGRAKRDAEELLLAAASRGEIEVCCLRPVNVYGPAMKGNLLTLIRLISKGVFPPLPTPGAALSLVGHRDLCEAALLAAESPRAKGQIYAVTDGRTYTMKGIEVTVRRALGKSPRRWQTPLPLLWAAAAVVEVLGKVLRLKNAPGLRSYRVLTTDNVFSCEKIQNELGYNPAATLTDELPAILQRLQNEQQKARD